MKTETLAPSATGLTNRIDYEKLTRLQLVERIIDGDTAALQELLKNRVISRPGYKRTRNLVEYVELLKQSEIAKRWCGYNALVLDLAGDLTIDRFSRIPARPDDAEQRRPRGSDCLPYFSAYMTHMTELLEERPPANALEAERIASEEMRKMVVRHFHFCCQEAGRIEFKFARRYCYAHPEGNIYVQVPWELPSGQCRAWLEANISDIQPRRLGEKQRIQAEIYRSFAKKQIFSLSELDRVGEKLPASPESLPSAIETRVSVDGLAQTVASEKAENISRQRPAIRLLGPKGVKELIHTIFMGLAYGEYVERDIARSFGLSTATLSRFAGSEWKKHGDDVSLDPVPDLWRNTAHTLAGHPSFVTASKKAGVWKGVYNTLHAARSRRNLR